MKRNLTLVLSALFLATATALAQPQRQKVTDLRCADTTLAQEESAPSFPQKVSTAEAQPALGGPRRAVITNQPDGTYYQYERSGSAYVYTIFGLYGTLLQGNVAEMVFADNDVVYLKNFVSQYDTQSWVKGRVEDNTIIFTFPQHILTYSGSPFYAMLMQLDHEQNTYVRADDQTLVLDYDAATGDIRVQAGSDFATGEQVVGLANSAGAWTGYADWNTTLLRVNSEPVAAPEELATSSFAATAEGFSGTLTQVGIDGNDIYVQGLYPGLPEAWVKGTISGDRAVFASGQYLGADMSSNVHVYLISARETADGYELTDDDITFSYDAATQTLSGGSLFLANAGHLTASAITVYKNARVKPFTETAATPATPSNLAIGEYGFVYYLRGYGWGVLQFQLPPTDADGEYILPEKLSYVIWTRVNGEEKPISLYSSDYEKLPVDQMDEVPYTYADGWDIYDQGNGTRAVYYFVVGPEAYGIQAVYRGAGEERRSDIAWASVQTLGAQVQPEAATPDYPEVDPSDVGGEIKFSPYFTGNTRGYFGSWAPQTIDVAIKVQDEGLTGAYIEEITIPFMRAKEISSAKVWISSQLRTENGENVPDLWSTDIEVTKAGNMVVTLPKPYIIPAEGVYVGYTVNIQENTYDGALGPVRTVEAVKPSGFYLRNTRDFLKWMDVSEGLTKSAQIDLKLGGSQVKNQAVKPLQGDDIFAKVDTDLKATLTFENHGGAGVKSVDVELTLNGQTTEQHLVPRSTVAGTWGLTFTSTVTLPGISQRGNYDLNVRVVKVNDEPNEDASPEATTTIHLMSSDPKHRPLFEEYTGTWCQWCPRGFVALEKLAKLYPDDYVCVSFHNSDPMEITTTFPSTVSGFPRGWIERQLSVDPYMGTSSKAFGVLDNLKACASVFGVADIFVEANLSADEKTVEVKTDLLFPFSYDNANYALEYMLVADGLTGPAGSSWDQVNAYAGGSDGSDFAKFNNAGSRVSGLVFNDVVVALSQVGGIEGSVPAEVKADVPVSHTYTFTLADAVNTSGENLIQDRDQLRVVVLLVDKSNYDATGGYAVVNANKARVATPTGMGTIVSRDAQVVSTRYYDVNGRPTQGLRQGVNLVQQVLGDGTVVTRKVVRR